MIYIDWEVVAAIGECVGAIATFVAVIVALRLPERKRIRMFFIFSPDITSDEFDMASLLVSNIGNKVIIIKRIDLLAGNEVFGEISYINDSFWLASREIKYLLPSETKRLSLPYNAMRKHIGHNVDVTDKNENKLVRIRLIDIEGKSFYITTNHTFKAFTELLFTKIATLH